MTRHKPTCALADKRREATAWQHTCLEESEAMKRKSTSRGKAARTFSPLCGSGIRGSAIARARVCVYVCAA